MQKPVWSRKARNGKADIFRLTNGNYICRVYNLKGSLIKSSVEYADRRDAEFYAQCQLETLARSYALWAGKR